VGSLPGRKAAGALT